MSQSWTLTVPFPPSVNTIFANIPGKGRIKTKAYRQWLNDAGWHLKSQKLPPQPIEGDTIFNIKFPSGFRAGDLDNRLKALLDLLVNMRVITDDSFIVDLRVRWAEVEACTVEIRSAK